MTIITCHAYSHIYNITLASWHIHNIICAIYVIICNSSCNLHICSLCIHHFSKFAVMKTPPWCPLVMYFITYITCISCYSCHNLSLMFVLHSYQANFHTYQMIKMTITVTRLMNADTLRDRYSRSIFGSPRSSTHYNQPNMTLVLIHPLSKKIFLDKNDTMQIQACIFIPKWLLWVHVQSFYCTICSSKSELSKMYQSSFTATMGPANLR